MTKIKKNPVVPVNPDACMCLALRMASRAVSQIYDETMRPVGLRVTQFSLLQSVRRLGPVTFQALAERMAIDETTLPRSLGLLKKHGYLVIEPGEDRRERLVSLAPKGVSILEKAIPYWHKAQQRMHKRFPTGRLDRLIAELKAMRHATAS